MTYSEQSYFDGYAFAHIAAWEDHLRLARKRATAQEHRRRSNRRGHN